MNVSHTDLGPVAAPGATPSSVAAPDAAPSSVAELSDAVRDLPGPLAPVGAGTAFAWGGPARVEHTVSLRGLDRVIECRPGDMTVAVGAGIRLTDLQAELAEHGQRLAFDPARARRGSTLGGLLATADSGPLAMRYGSLRDLVIGATVVLADGTVAHTGGHVIKNVAGFDLAKLLHGAYGTLAVAAELVLRVHPVPTRRRWPCPTCRARRSAIGTRYSPQRWHGDMAPRGRSSAASSAPPGRSRP